MPPSQQTEISNSWNDTTALLNHLTTTAGYLNPVEDWLHGMARVHDKMKHLENCVLLREALVWRKEICCCIRYSCRI
ncbi:hypothetical protein [Chitinophaga pinensis]|uniref:hypothetical protein n=1 Tax=Chitinophaga pinensis TaxID=79329 RepID=UPI001C9938BA|nr:hypothetical protein [Chitinophaga pinensis]